MHTNILFLNHVTLNAQLNLHSIMVGKQSHSVLHFSANANARMAVLEKKQEALKWQ